jgi:hypothetical protein
MVKDSGFEGADGFAKPTAEQQKIVDEAVGEMMKEEAGKREGNK